MENIKINYSKEYIKELVAECVFFLACMILSFFIALFSRKNTDNQQSIDFSNSVAVLIIVLIILLAIMTLQCQKFCVNIFLSLMIPLAYSPVALLSFPVL